MSRTWVIGVLGGTGAQGRGLALRWALKGHEVVIGSRDLERANAGAAGMNKILDGKATVRGATNRDAAQAATIVVLAVPYEAQAGIAEDVRNFLPGKILVDVTVPLVPPRVDCVQLPNGESAVVALQRRLGSGVRVVSAFQNVSAFHLKDPTHPVDCDVLVCSDDADARETVVELANDAGMRAWHAGPLANSVAVEALTSIIIAINKRYKVPASGIRITGVPDPDKK